MKIPKYLEFWREINENGRVNYLFSGYFIALAIWKFSKHNEIWGILDIFMFALSYYSGELANLDIEAWVKKRREHEKMV